MSIDATISRSGAIAIRGGTLRAPGGPIAIGESPITVGRDRSCTVVLDDRQVSAVHAELVATPEGVVLRDLGSKNGTFVAGARVRDAQLVGRVELGFGETKLAFEPSLPEPLARPPRTALGPLVGASAVMQQLFDTLSRVAPTDLTVLLLGETGTGKELAARAIHESSKRRAGPFVVVDCGAISPALAEAHFFGHEKGAFTGAIERRESPFVEANGGTLFLDELGELPLELQPKLLRVLAERRLKPVGGNAYLPVDVRIVAATRQDLSRMVNEGSFRSDLYFRVAELRAPLPPLRERLDDVPMLLRKMLADLGDPDAYARIRTDNLERLMRRPWPGNVRELKNAVRVAHALADGGAIDVAMHGGEGRSPELDAIPSAEAGYHPAKQEALERFEKAYFSALAATTGGVIAEMARVAGLERAHVRKYLRRHGLAKPPKQPR